MFFKESKDFGPGIHSLDRTVHFGMVIQKHVPPRHSDEIRNFYRIFSGLVMLINLSG